jgi:hypothetical protein
MNTQEAVEAVNGMVFKPGWRVTAADFLGMVEVTMYIDTVDTSYPDADGTCRKQVTLYREKMINPGGLDLEGLCYQVLKLAMETDVHEDREFLKVRGEDGRWYSPLHPHTRAGEEAWADNLRKDSQLSRVFV